MEERIRLRIGTILNDNEVDILGKDGNTLFNDLCKVVEQEIEKAYQRGWKDGSKGKVFEKIEVETDVHFKDLKDVLEGKESPEDFIDKLN